ncbi:MAG: hypothetical protein A3F17_02885 [Gammaproteobacteria bacterium RIFCSPHIGHO2_12_FULL_41_15]|nr:MAG: hypothetical protein A3F17_02885 [Gammaproteobacteria bacterium RIFCSPHIGHO2_12_FULL_41_15]
MQDFRAYQSTISLWYDLMQGAQEKGDFYLQENVESYIVFLLMRFTERPEIANVVLAEDYLLASQRTGVMHHEKMRDVADGCLLHAGFYPDRSIRKNVSVNYFLDMGRIAYRSLTVLPERIWTGPYHDLEDKIDDAARVLALVNQMQ